MAVVALTVGVVAAYNVAAPEIAEPSGAGQIFVFFDRPGVEATVEVDVKAANMQAAEPSDTYDIHIRVGSLGEDDPPQYYIVLSGTALPLSGDNAGSRDDVSDECGHAVSGSLDVTCMATRGSPESAYVSDERKEPLVVVSGQIERFGTSPDSGQGWVTVDARPLSTVESRERRTFQLPTVGTVSLPEELRFEPLQTIDNIRAFAPKLTTMVIFSRLGATDVLDAVSEEPYSRQPLTWIDQHGSQIAISGSILNVGEERRSERLVFVWGVIAGVVGGFVPPALALVLRRRRVIAG